MPTSKVRILDVRLHFKSENWTFAYSKLTLDFCLRKLNPWKIAYTLFNIFYAGKCPIHLRQMSSFQFWCRRISDVGKCLATHSKITCKQHSRTLNFFFIKFCIICVLNRTPIYKHGPHRGWYQFLIRKTPCVQLLSCYQNSWETNTNYKLQ